MKFLSKFSVKMKLLLVVILLSAVAVTGTIIYSNVTGQTDVKAVSATSKKINMEEEIIEEVKEEVVAVAVDNSPEESLLQDGDQEEITFNDQKVTVPKSTVAPANSAEDAESGKKNGGDAINQEQANQMFQNEGVTSRGIDVSAHQGNINWAQVAASGVDFAMIRVGFRGQTSGGIYEDAYFKTNVTGAIANGIKVGIYFYSTAINENEALEEAVWVVKKISTYRITYPVVYDFEDFNSKRCINVGGQQATSNALTFLSFVQANGYEPMMYANKNDITTKMSRGAFQMKFWLAHYTTQTDYAGNYQMWQYTSKGSVPGISGNVDMNIAYFSYGTTAAPKHTHDYSEEVKNSYNAPTCTSEGSRVVRCSCGDSHTETIAATGHNFGSWEVRTSPTTEAEGVEVRICSNCKAEETRTINKLTHTHSYTEAIIIKNATCTETGEQGKKCSCGDIGEKTTISALGHSFGEWEVIKEPTTELEGEKQRVCMRDGCTASETEKIQKLTVEAETPEVTE